MFLSLNEMNFQFRKQERVVSMENDALVFYQKLLFLNYPAEQKIFEFWHRLI